MAWSQWITPDPDAYDGAVTPVYSTVTAGDGIAAPAAQDTASLGAQAWSDMLAATTVRTGVDDSVGYGISLERDQGGAPVQVSAGATRSWLHATLSGAAFADRFIWTPADIPQMAALREGTDYLPIPGRTPGAVDEYVDYEATTTTFLGWAGDLGGRLLINYSVFVAGAPAGSGVPDVPSSVDWPNPQLSATLRMQVDGVAYAVVPVTSGPPSAGYSTPYMLARMTPYSVPVALSYADSPVLSIDYACDEPAMQFAGIPEDTRGVIVGTAAYGMSFLPNLPGLDAYYQRPRLRYWTALEPPLRLAQRNDGAGPNGHPRLRASVGASTSVQTSVAPRVGTVNRYR